tara:strand:- start:708 stop:860 length:153 start_codon:yes stop_codon:yes gene_type:complete
MSEALQMSKERIEKALKDLSILVAQVGNARIRELYRKPLEQFIKDVAKTQ